MSTDPKSTTLTELRGALVPKADTAPMVHIGFDNSQGFDLMQRGAKLLAASTLVPKDYQNNIPNCVIALNMASRLGADPLLVMQNLYLVHGKPGWSSQFLIATFNKCGRFSAIRYQWGGTEGKDDWSCRAYAKELDTGEVIHGPTISILLAKKEGWYEKQGSKWKTLPQLMLMYRAAAWLVRTHAPELSMGLQTAEEVGDIYDTSRDAQGRFSVTTDDLRRSDVTPPSPPEFNTEVAKNLLREATSPDGLEAAWTTIMDNFPLDQDMPTEVDALYKARKQELTP